MKFGFEVLFSPQQQQSIPLSCRADRRLRFLCARDKSVCNSVHRLQSFSLLRFVTLLMEQTV